MASLPNRPRRDGSLYTSIASVLSIGSDRVLVAGFRRADQKERGWIGWTDERPQGVYGSVDHSNPPGHSFKIGERSELTEVYKAIAYQDHLQPSHGRQDSLLKQVQQAFQVILDFVVAIVRLRLYVRHVFI